MLFKGIGRTFSTENDQQYETIGPLVIVASAIIWSSLELKRYTVPQLVGGIAVCIIAFGISLVGGNIMRL